MRINTETLKYFLMIKSPYTKSGVMLLKTSQLSSLSDYEGWTESAMHNPIRDLGQWIPCTYRMLDPKILSNFER